MNVKLTVLPNESSGTVVSGPVLDGNAETALLTDAIIIVGVLAIISVDVTLQF